MDIIQQIRAAEQTAGRFGQEQVTLFFFFDRKMRKLTIEWKAEETE